MFLRGFHRGGHDADALAGDHFGEVGEQPGTAEGFGFPATWKRKDETSSVLMITKDARTLTVEIRAQMSPDDQLGWLKAWAAAALPTV